MAPGLAVGISLAVSLLAWRGRALTGGGAAAAATIGTVILWRLGWVGGAVLLAFFLPSTIVGRVGSGRPTASDARGEVRDEVQVLANGAAAAGGALSDALWPGLGLWILTGALAAAAADTWATSLGAFSRREPRDLLRGRPVPRGTSGGVSTEGTLGGAAGALLVSATAAVAEHGPGLLVSGLAIGLAGMFLDSLLGATVQAKCVCPSCGTPSERRRHRCGTPTDSIGGWRWLDNDGVNAITTVAAGLAGALAWWVAAR